MNTARQNQQTQPATINEPTRAEFIARLSYIQANLVAGKGQQNNFANFAYRKAADILAALKPFLDGLVVKLNSEVVEISGRWYVKTTASITDGVNVESAAALAREPENKKGMDDSQVSGAATTYSKKYALENLFMIDDNQDADSFDNSKNNRQNHQQNNRQYHQPQQQARPMNNHQNNRQNNQQQPQQQPQQNERVPYVDRSQQGERGGYLQDMADHVVRRSQGQQRPQPHASQEPAQQEQQQEPRDPQVLSPNQYKRIQGALKAADIDGLEQRFCKSANIQHIGALQAYRFESSLEWIHRKAMG